MKWSEKASGFAPCNCFALISNPSEKVKIRSLTSGFFVHMRQFHFDFYFLIKFFLGFPNPFIVHSRPCFFLFEPNFNLSLLVFCSHAVFRHDFLIFLKKCSVIFFEMVFSKSLIIRSRSNFLCSQRKFFEMYVRTCSAMFFTSSNKNFSLYLSSQLVQHFAWNLFDVSSQII